MQKRGALELSVNTIIVIVIGVTILTLGLVFVQKIFSETDKTGTKVFQDLEGRLGEVNAQKFLTLIPSSFDLEQGKTQQVSVVVANLEEGDYGNVIATVENLNKGDINCAFAATNSLKSRSYTIPSGKQVSMDLRVQALGNARLGDKTCNVVVSGNGVTEPDTEASLAINVIK